MSSLEKSELHAYVSVCSNKAVWIMGLTLPWGPLHSISFWFNKICVPKNKSKEKKIVNVFSHVMYPPT